MVEKDRCHFCHFRFEIMYSVKYWKYTREREKVSRPVVQGNAPLAILRRLPPLQDQVLHPGKGKK